MAHGILLWTRPPLGKQEQEITYAYYAIAAIGCEVEIRIACSPPSKHGEQVSDADFAVTVYIRGAVVIGTHITGFHRLLSTDVIPFDVATIDIKATDHLATCGISAAWCSCVCATITESGAWVAEVIAETTRFLESLVGANLIPHDIATKRIRSADEFTARCVIAAGCAIVQTATSGARARLACAVTFTRRLLDRLIGAELIPLHIAAKRINGAN